MDGYWIHLDVDVFGDRVMLAVDSPQPGGLSYQELTTLVAPLLASDLDPNGSIARGLVDALVALFERARLDVPRPIAV